MLKVGNSGRGNPNSDAGLNFQLIYFQINFYPEDLC